MSENKEEQHANSVPSKRVFEKIKAFTDVYYNRSKSYSILKGKNLYAFSQTSLGSALGGGALVAVLGFIFNRSTLAQERDKIEKKYNQVKQELQKELEYSKDLRQKLEAVSNKMISLTGEKKTYREDLKICDTNINLTKVLIKNSFLCNRFGPDISDIGNKNFSKKMPASEVTKSEQRPNNLQSK